MVVVIGRVRVAEDELGQWNELIAELVGETRAEPQCITYTFSRDLDDPATFHIVEEWDDHEALRNHVKSDHFRAWSRALRELTVHEQVVRVYDATESSF